MANESVAPVIASAAVATNGLSIAVLMTEAGSPPILPATGVTGFSVKVDEVDRTITSATASSLTVTLNVTPAIQQGQTVKVSYSGGNVTDSADTPNSLTSFSNHAVTNNSTVPDVTAPAAPNITATVTQKVVLTWDEVPDAAYKVYRDGVELDDVNAGTFTYTDDTQDVGENHVYRVSAIDNSDNEASSGSVELHLGLNINTNKMEVIVEEPNSVLYKDTDGVLYGPTKLRTN